MTRSAYSQITEHVFHVGTAVGLPLLLLSYGASMPTAIAGASFGAVTGWLGALAIMIYYYYRTKPQRLKERAQQPTYDRLGRRVTYQLPIRTLYD